MDPTTETTDTALPARQRLRDAAALYAACLFFCGSIIAAAVTFSWLSGWLFFPAYFACGFLLNRSVLRTLIEWHPVYNTVTAVSTAKLKFFLFWPVNYFALFFRLVVLRVL